MSDGGLPKLAPGELREARNLATWFMAQGTHSQLAEVLEQREVFRKQIAELTQANTALREQVTAFKAEVYALLKSPEVGELTFLRLYLKDTTEDMECLPLCDSYGHEEQCPVTNVMAAFRQLKSLLAEKERELTEKTLLLNEGWPGLTRTLRYALQDLKAKEAQLQSAVEVLTYYRDAHWKCSLCGRNDGGHHGKCRSDVHPVRDGYEPAREVLEKIQGGAK